MSRRNTLSEILTFDRKTNALVLSDDLDDDTVQTLVSVALGDLFPELCREWRSKKQDIRDIFFREKSSRKSAVVQDVAKTEGSLRRVLREEIVAHVISLFPYCFLTSIKDTALIWYYRSLDREGLSSRTRVHGDANPAVESTYTFDSFL